MTALFEHSPWIEARADGRPSSGDRHADLMAVVCEATPDEQLALIRAHPELAGKAAVHGTLTEASAAEQASAGSTASRPTSSTAPTPSTPPIATASAFGSSSACD